VLRNKELHAHKVAYILYFQPKLMKIDAQFVKKSVPDIQHL